MESEGTHIAMSAVELGNLLYRKALVRREEEPITDPRGRPIGWLLDTRIPMLETNIFCEVGRVLEQKLRNRGIRQVAGRGYGAFPIVCSIVGMATGQMSGGFVRSKRKTHGRKRLIEGPLNTAWPVVLVDDILNSGQSAELAVTSLRESGFEVDGVVTLFNFTWGGGKSRLERDGLWVESLLDINLRETTKSVESLGSDFV